MTTIAVIYAWIARSACGTWGRVRAAILHFLRSEIA
jgi:hypothetical protein